jgi:hypothetical protein
VQFPQPLRVVRRYLPPRFAQQCVGQKASAHSDLAVNAPHRQLDARRRERFAPSEDMLVNAVHKRPVEIEHKTLAGHGRQGY